MTLDGYKYTFNGRGEFTLIEAANSSFTLQGRMVDIASQNGGAPLATVFSAIVAREVDSDTVQFEISARDGIVARVNGEEVDFNVVEQQFKNVTVTDLGIVCCLLQWCISRGTTGKQYLILSVSQSSRELQGHNNTRIAGDI